MLNSSQGAIRSSDGWRQGHSSTYTKLRSSISLSKASTLPLARWYQEVLGMAPEGMLGIDRQKLAILLCLLVKNSYGGALLQKHGLIWEKKVKCRDEPEEYGLGFKDVINEYGFGWLNPAI